MTFSQIITEIKSFPDYQVQTPGMIVRSSHFFADKNQEAIELIGKSCPDLRKNQEARRRKKNVFEILQAIRSGEGLSDPFSPYDQSPFSIYPLKED